MTLLFPIRSCLTWSARRWRLVPMLWLALLMGGCASVAPSPGASSGDEVAVRPATGSSPMRRGLEPVVPSGPLSALGSASPQQVTVVPLAAPVDIWDRIRRGFAMPDLDSELVRDREQWYASRPDYIQRMTERSSRYLFHIVEEIERRNMPTELALLPFIESAFNPQAVSSARAAGMWQFMPATGQSFDLKQNMFRDDRRDVLASTRAALDYLEQLHTRFGDWHLALAAYNWGQGNVNRAITRNQRDGQPTGYTDLSMPMETRLYVPKLQAVKNIVARPESFNARLPDIGNHPYFETISLERDMDVAVIARLAEISEKDFRALNPSLKQPLVMAAGTPNILLPWDSATTFQRNLQAYGGPLASWTAWVVPSTMSAAQAAERVGMDEDELRDINNIPPRMRVRAGSTLLVPRGTHRDNDVPGHVADNGQLSLQPEIILRKTTVRARKGDNLARLAGRYGVSPVSAAGWNKLAVSARLKPGQRITLMLPRQLAVPAQAAGGRDQDAARTVARKPQAGAKGRFATATARAGKAAGKATARTSTKAGKVTQTVAAKGKKAVKPVKRGGTKVATSAKPAARP